MTAEKTFKPLSFKDSVFLPKTSFSMKANLPQNEPSYLQKWEGMNLYGKLRQKSEGKEKFILHFGPPYANGHIHMGHALSEVLKDVLNKIKQMQGFDAPLVPGWDCHGLPIEWQIEKQYQAKGQSKDYIDVIEFRQECRSFAKTWMGVQKEEFKRLGIVADWKDPYNTMDFESEAAIVEEIGKLLMSGALVKGLKPVMWSVIEKTALAEAEVEYKDKESDAIFVSFPIKSSAVLAKNVEAVIWTTTPWSLPGNRALAFGNFDYTVIKVTGVAEGAEHLLHRSFLIAENLAKGALDTWGVDMYETVQTLKGEELKGAIACHPLKDLGYTFEVPFLYGSHVTLDAGTGLVHTAPSHGMDDYILGLNHQLCVPNTLHDDGVFTKEAPHFEGMHVFKVNPEVLIQLKAKSALIHATKMMHSYPHSWRSKAPIIYRATPQWFIKMEGVRESALHALSNTRFVPEKGRGRITSMIEGRPDWCISRQRAWGTPLTLFVHKQSGDVLRDEDVHGRIVERIKKDGGDAWYNVPSEVFLGEKYNANDFEKINDVVDVWLDAGCSHAFVLEKRPELQSPADVYFEGSDQHRGWFQSSLLQSVITRNRAPYKTLVTHGFILDDKGYKMSKSAGNGMDPADIIKQYGADILRLWVTFVDYNEDVRIGKELLKQLQDIYRRFRNTLRYLLGALEGYTLSEEVPFKDLPELEKSMLSRLHGLQKKMDDVAESYQFADFYTELHHFCAMDLSAFYFDIRKDSLYCDHATALSRKATRTVMHHILVCLMRWLAPVLSFTSEEAYSHFKEMMPGSHEDSVHLTHFLALPDDFEDQTLNKKYEKMRSYRRFMTGALEKARAAKEIGSSLQAMLHIYATPDVKALFEGMDTADFAITSHVVWHDLSEKDAQPLYEEGGTVLGTRMEDSHAKDIAVVIHRAEGEKCERCWKVTAPAQVDVPLCHRCFDVLQTQKEV